MKEINKEKVAKTAKKVAKVLGKTALVFAGGTLVVGGAMSLMGCPGPTDAPKEKAYTDFGGIPVYLNGVSEGDAATVIGHINTVYTAWSAGQKLNWADGRVTRVNIVNGAGTSQSGRVLDIGKDADLPTVGPFLGGIIVFNLLDNSIRLAGQFDTAKETVRLTFGKLNGQRMI